MDTPSCDASKYFGNAPKDAINFSIGEPVFSPPESVVAAYGEAVKSGGYAPIQGYQDLREKISDKLIKENGIDSKAENILITNGATEAIAFSIMSLVGKGDEVVVFEPNYPIVSPMVRYCGGRAVIIPLKEDNGFQIDPDDVRNSVTDKTKLMVINSPHNPTGTVFKKKVLKEISEIYKGCILSDEVYEKIVYEDRHHSIASFSENPERVITVNSFSKTYCMCGFRVGYLHASNELIRHLLKLKLYVTNCCPAPSQKAAIAAMDDKKFPARIRRDFCERRRTLLSGFKKLKIPCVEPKGAFYAFPNISEFGSDEEVHDMLMNAGILTMPGTIFSPSCSEHVRFSYVCRIDQIKEGIRRMENLPRRNSITI